MLKHSLKITLLATLISASVNAATVDLRVIETTDLHSNMMDFDYYRDQATDKYGLVRTATLIKAAKAEVVNSVLVDNGDLIQGSPMADYVVKSGLKDGEIHPVYKVMNTLGYVVGNIGNHEFNFGLDYLKTALSGAAFPYVNANVFDAETGKPYFQQYIIVDTKVKDRDGKEQTVRIGYIGFVPPQVMLWDKANLEGKVIAKDITETAKELVPQMRKEGADLVVAIPHSGVSSDPYKAMAENSVYYLSQVEGIDAIMFGHSHGVFPSKDFAALPGVNLENGTLNGVPAVMPGQWGDHLGIVDLVLDGEAGNWKVTNAKAEARPIFDKAASKSVAEADQNLRKILEDDHNHTREFVGQPIGKASDDMYSFLSLVQDDPTVQIVNAAQKAYVEYHIQGDPDLDGLPVLSAAAPFKAGGRKNDPTAYVEVKGGELSFRNAADLYLYANTLVALKVTGDNVQEWLECSAGQFNQIDVNKTEPQELLNWTTFRTYNFDVIDGVNYQIDVTQPARYDGECQLINPDAHRITNLTYQGKPIDPKATFILASNNYRAFTGKFAGTGPQNVVINSPDEVRTVLAAYITDETKKHGQVVPTADNNWSFVPLKSDKTLDIRFETSPSELAAKFIKEKAQYPMSYLDKDSGGFAVYKIDLQQK